MATTSESHPPEVPIGDLEPLELPAHAAPRPGLQSLSDDELLNAVRSPSLGDRLVINTRTGKLHDGNGRAHESKRRADDSTSDIESSMLVPVEYYTPDLSMFPDLNG